MLELIKHSRGPVGYSNEMGLGERVISGKDTKECTAKKQPHLHCVRTSGYPSMRGRLAVGGRAGEEDNANERCSKQLRGLSWVKVDSLQRPRHILPVKSKGPVGIKAK